MVSMNVKNYLNWTISSLSYI